MTTDERTHPDEAAVKAALEGEAAVLDAASFEGFLAGIARTVLANVGEVRAGKLSAEDAAKRDDATVRSLAQVLMGEHAKIRAELPATGPALVKEMEENIPALFRQLPEGADRANPRAMMVHACRIFLSELYTMIRACAAEGDRLTPQMLKDRIEGFAAVWAVRFMGDAPGRARA